MNLSDTYVATRKRMLARRVLYLGRRQSLTRCVSCRSEENLDVDDDHHEGVEEEKKKNNRGRGNRRCLKSRSAYRLESREDEDEQYYLPSINSFTIRRLDTREVLALSGISQRKFRALLREKSGKQRLRLFSSAMVYHGWITYPVAFKISSSSASSFLDRAVIFSPSLSFSSHLIRCSMAW